MRRRTAMAQNKRADSNKMLSALQYLMSCQPLFGNSSLTLISNTQPVVARNRFLILAPHSYTTITPLNCSPLSCHSFFHHNRTTESLTSFVPLILTPQSHPGSAHLIRTPRRTFASPLDCTRESLHTHEVSHPTG